MFWRGYELVVRRIVWALAALSGLCLLLLVAVTCVDIVLRRFDLAFPGAVDLAQVLGCLCVAAALPYTTAVKGHIAVEYFFRRLPRRWRVFFDTCTRLLGIALFAILAWQSFVYGSELKSMHKMTMTLNIPWFWVLWTMGVAFVFVILVKLFHLTHPGKELIRP
ncbi:MAG: TRAP transporter small permease [Oligosphaeraceae bacterium]|nr:TRAP transporter small permease [Oligosphaeraceae bacterium]